MMFIPLSQGLFTLVDDDVYEELSKFKWYVSHEGRNRMYAFRLDRENGNRHTRIHRVIMGAKPDKVVDHQDGNPLNNLRSNLRICTQWENGKNVGLRVNNTSGWKGVSWQKNRGYWQAIIRINGKMTGVGCFENPIHAAMAYNEAALEHHGEFARLNSISPEDIVRYGPPRRFRQGDKLKATNTSGISGVSWNKASQVWYAFIRYQGDRLYLGQFLTKWEAAYVIDQVTFQLHGDTAKLNILDKDYDPANTL